MREFRNVDTVHMAVWERGEGEMAMHKNHKKRRDAEENDAATLQGQYRESGTVRLCSVRDLRGFLILLDHCIIVYRNRKRALRDVHPGIQEGQESIALLFHA